MDFLTPNVYLKDVPSVVNMPTGSDPVSAFVGVTATGPVGVPTIVNSWSEFLSIYAVGQETPFLTNSFLAHAVYGFFQNGGKKCYVLRVTNGTVTSGVLTYNGAKAKDSASGSSDFQKAFSAKYEGTWGNKITVEAPKSEASATLGTFTINVKYSGNIVETFPNLRKGVNVNGCWADIINANSQYITVTNKALEAPVSTIASNTVTATFTGGTDGLATSGQPVPDTILEPSLTSLDKFDDIKLVAIPGASDDMQVKLATYCTNSGYRIAICESQQTSTNAQLVTLRTNLEGLNAFLYSVWGKVTNPLSSSGALISIPLCGHICGVYSRISDTRGFWKAVAGTEAVIRGVIEPERLLTNSDTDLLNPKGINAIIVKANYGVVIWGAKSCNSELGYTTSLYTHLTIKKALYDLTQPLVFEPNDNQLWTKATAICQDYLKGLYDRGALFGQSTSEAFMVVCNESNNPKASRDMGKLNIEVGYAPKKPAEFVVISISHELTDNT